MFKRLRTQIWKPQEHYMTRVTLESEDGLYIIESPENMMTVEKMYDIFFNPIMLAATYDQENINDYFQQKSHELDNYKVSFEGDKECECEECSCAR